MKKAELLKLLREEVSPKELDLIKTSNMPNVSKYNCQTVTEMMTCDGNIEGDVAEEKVDALRRVTYDYLKEYFSEHEEAWKWIFLSCAYLSFIKEVPMHPKEIVHYEECLEGDKRIYYCPAKSKEPNTSCEYCVCRRKEEH